MNRIVRQHYPAARLPEDLREAVGAGAHVTITIEVEDGAAGVTSSEVRDWFSTFEHVRRDNFRSDDELLEYARGLRRERDGGNE